MRILGVPWFEGQCHDGHAGEQCQGPAIICFLRQYRMSEMAKVESTTPDFDYNLQTKKQVVRRRWAEQSSESNPSSLYWIDHAWQKGDRPGIKSCCNLLAACS